MRPLLAGLALAAGCHHAPPAPIVSNHPAATPSTGDRAYVVEGGALVEVAADAPARPVVHDDIQWCATDARARVVWFVTGAGLSAFDLDDHRVHQVIDGELVARADGDAISGRLEIVIDYGEQKLGGENAIDFDVGLAIHMTAKPTLAKVAGCDGDRAVYCYDEHGHPSSGLVALEKRAAQISLADPAYVASLAARGASGSLWTPPPIPPIAPAPPTVDRARCSEIAEACGQLTAIPGSPLWLVTTDNSRGDFFHETRELWDPRTAEYVRVDGARIVRTTQLPGDDGGDYAGMRVSPSGGLSIGGAVFDDRRVLHASKHDDVSLTCGWASGGWRVKGTVGE